MKKLMIGGMSAVLAAVMASCGSVSELNELKPEPASSEVKMTFTLDGQEISREAVEQLEITNKNVFLYPTETAANQLSVQVFVERPAMESFLKSRVTSQKTCIFGIGSKTTTVYDLTNFNQSGGFEDFDVNDDEDDLRNNSKPGGNNGTWYLDISSIESSGCFTTVLYKGLNQTGSAWFFDGQDVGNMGSWNNATKSIELFYP
jgi:hypothetical protein